MSKIQWEYDLVERPFCEQLKAMGWEWIEGDTDVPDFTERQNFREVLLKARLATALRKLNLRDGQPWLDDDRIRRVIEKLERAEGHRLMEINESTTTLLLKGTEIDGLSDWNFGRNQPVRFIDFENPANNDFLVINQFKVELTSGRGHVIPDAVLFVNGIPLGVAEFKSPGIENPLQEAINQLLRYSNQRRELWPTLYTDHEGVERLFHTNQLLIASNFFESRAATIGAPPEAYLEWTDTSPVPLSTVAQELGILPSSPDEAEAARELAAVGPERGDRTGIPLFFRKPEQRPEALRGQGGSLQSQQILAAGMLRPAHLLDLIRNFTVFHFRRWYMETGTDWLQQRVEWLSQHTTRKPEKIEVRDLGFRWGSCGKGGVVYFNWKALQLPVRLVDYIIMHELVHLVEGHHGPEFWQALGRAMPDWQKRKDALADKAKDYLVFGLPSGRAASRLGAAGEK